MNSIRNIDWRQTAPRMAIDFALVQIAMVLSLAISVLYQQAVGSPREAERIADGFIRYYALFFLPLSPVFPLLFLARGFYSRVRSYAPAAKYREILKTIGISLGLFLAANFLAFPASDEPVGRSVALPFTVLSIAGLLGARLLRALLYKSNPAPTSEEIVETKPVLIVGGAGYIGCWLARRLLEEGARVRILDSAVYGLEPIEEILTHPRLEFQAGDCRNIQDVVKAVSGVSSVIHLAAIVGDPACEIDHRTSLEINYAATRMLAEVAKGAGVERFLFASSCSVYGATDEIMDENSKVEPISLYGKTKIDSERALLESATDSFHPVIMRFATVFGLSKRPRFDLVVNLLAAKAQQESVITIFNGQQWRPFVHVQDLAEAIILLLKAPLASVSREVFNVGDNRLNHTLRDVAEGVQAVFPNTRIEEVENADRRNYRVNFDRIEQRVGFRCRWTLDAGIRQIRDAFADGLIADYKDTRFSNVGFLRKAGTPENKSEFDAGVMQAFAFKEIGNLAGAGK
jgi:nucleoside-diphosphate-sugar epimerase